MPLFPTICPTVPGNGFHPLSCLVFSCLVLSNARIGPCTGPRRGGGGGGGHAQDPKMANFGPKNGQKWCCPKRIPDPLRSIFGLFSACFNPLSACKHPTFAPFGAICARFEPFWLQVPPKWPISGQKMQKKKCFPKKNVPRPFGKVNGAYLGQFRPVLRVKGWS